MKYRINTGGTAFCDSVNGKNAFFYAVLGYILAKGGAFDADSAAKTLEIAVEDVRIAEGFWIGSGVISPESGNTVEGEKTADTSEKHTPLHEQKERGIPDYTASDLAEKIEGNKELSSLIDFCSRVLEKVLNSAEISEIVYLVDTVGLTSTMVMKLVDYFSAKGKRGVRYITKAAVSIYDEGVENDAALDEYIRKKSEYDSGEAFVKQLIGAGGRAFTKKERVLVDKWFSEWKLDKDAVSMAYERTVDKIAKPSLPYMSKILEKWVSSGCRSAKEITAFESSEGKSNNSSGLSLSDFDEAAASAEASDTSTDQMKLDMDRFFDS